MQFRRQPFTLPLFRQRKFAGESLQPVIRGHEVPRALHDALFQVGVQPAQRLFGAFALAQLHLQRVIGHFELGRP